MHSLSLPLIIKLYTRAQFLPTFSQLRTLSLAENHLQLPKNIVLACFVLVSAQFIALCVIWLFTRPEFLVHGTLVHASRARAEYFGAFVPYQSLHLQEYCFSDMDERKLRYELPNFHALALLCLQIGYF